MKGKIAAWNATKLSFAGRITLAQSVLNTMPLYAMQTLKLPASTCSSMEKTIRGVCMGEKIGEAMSE